MGNSSLIQLPKFSNIHTQKWVTQGETRINGQTVNNLITSESDPVAARFLFTNRSATETDVCGFDVVKISPTSSINDGFSPKNGSGVVDNTMWTPFTFDGGGAFDPLNEVIRSGVRLNFNGAPPLDTSVPSSFIERVVCSDLVPVKSLPRLDSPAVNLPLWHVRGYSAGFVPVTFNTNVLQTDWQIADNGRKLISFNKPGDGVTTPANFTSPTVGDYVISAGIQWVFKNRGLNVLEVGDSTHVGDMQYNTSGGQQGPVFLAVTGLSTPALPITLTQLARSGSRQPSFSRQLRAYMDVVRPDVVVIPGYSVNNSISQQSNIDDCVAAAFNDARYCLQRGAIPIITTPSPWGFAGPSAVAFSALIALLQAAAPNFAILADVYAATVDPANPQKPLPGSWATASPYHLLRATNQMIADTVYAPILQQIIAGRPTA
jgi:hypothetical protein